jgi:L-glyceraldehyde reductase
MAVSKKVITLSSGFQMPVIGLGTSVSHLPRSYQFLLLISSSFSTDSSPPDQAEVENTVKTALEAGYRHIDCAPVYQNEAAVGRGIKASGVPRGDLFVRTSEAPYIFYRM